MKQGEKIGIVLYVLITGGYTLLIRLHAVSYTLFYWEVFVEEWGIFTILLSLFVDVVLPVVVMAGSLELLFHQPWDTFFLKWSLLIRLTITASAMAIYWVVLGLTKEPPQELLGVDTIYRLDTWDEQFKLYALFAFDWVCWHKVQRIKWIK